MSDTDTNPAESIGVVAPRVIDPWAWWQNALKGNFGPIHDGEPNQGYYRTKRGDPVAIWKDDDGKWLAYEDRREVDARDVWTWCCQRPVTYKAYNHRIKNGVWPDDPPKLPPAPTVGHNSGETDPFEAMKMEFLGEKELADEFLSSPVTTQADADKAAVWSKRIAEISKKAEAERKVEKQPHIDAGKAVDNKWRDLIEGSKDIVAKLKKHVEPYLIAESKKEQERQRKAQEEAERLRKAAQEATESDSADLARQAEEAEKASQAKQTAAGRTGAKVSIRVEKVGHVTDYQKAAAALVAMKHSDMIDCIDRLAQRAAKSGMAFDGMEIKENEVAR